MNEDKELMEIMENNTNIAHETNCEAAIKAIIARYPQVLAEKVWEGECFQVEAIDKSFYSQTIWSKPPTKKIKVYIEVVS